MDPTQIWQNNDRHCLLGKTNFDFFVGVLVTCELLLVNLKIFSIMNFKLTIYGK
jgi:hypothetical protein